MSVLQYLDAPNVRVSNFHPTNEDIRELGTWPLAVLKQLGCYEYLSGEDWQLLLLPQSWLAAVPEGHNMFVLGEGESPFSRKEAEEFPPILGISPWGIIRGNLDNALPELSIDKTADAAVNMVRTMWASFIRGVMDKEGVDKAVILVLQFVSGVIDKGNNNENAELAMLVLDLLKQTKAFPEFTKDYMDKNRAENPTIVELLENARPVLIEYGRAVAEKTKDWTKELEAENNG